MKNDATDGNTTTPTSTTQSTAGAPDTGTPDVPAFDADAVDPARLEADIEAIASFSESAPEVGYSRPTFSKPWRAARDYVIGRAQEIGAEHRIDAAGNVHIRHRSVGWDRPVWLSGSHIDSVPSGGKYDGVMGVVVPLEVMRVAPRLPVEVVVFAEEEGTTFNLGMLGSRIWCGKLPVGRLAELTNRHGRTVLEAGADHGLDESSLHRAEATETTAAPDGSPSTSVGAADGDGRTVDSSGDDHDSADRNHAAGLDAAMEPWMVRIDPARYLGFVEVHAEQGLHLWREGIPLAAVDRINGRRQFEIVFHGQANHAGSTGMPGRRDALTGAAETVVAVEELGRELDRERSHTVMTVGTLSVRPGAINVIPGEVHLSVDFRAQDEAILDRGEELLRDRVKKIAGRRTLEVQIQRSERIAPTPLSAPIGRALVHAAAELGTAIPIVPSGALHDAAIIAAHVPTAMVFVASRDGISHNPDEFSRLEDIVMATRVVGRMIAHDTTPLTVKTLNELPTAIAVDRCAGFFEHSPWIVEAALADRPFADLAEFHAACMRVVAAAGEERREALINAHPDLVGRLAREGRLTRESTAEQAAAGLNALSPEEVEAFERYNESYRRRFGFPFVICARANKKEAILEAFPRRLDHDRATEIDEAIEQIGRIAWLRMNDAIHT